MWWGLHIPFLLYISILLIRNLSIPYVRAYISKFRTPSIGLWLQINLLINK